MQIYLDYLIAQTLKVQAGALPATDVKYTSPFIVNQKAN
jgi:hypothetical protein